MKTIYLDHNATTPLARELERPMLQAARELFGNPSSSHRLGREARRLIDESRERVAALLGCQATNVVFTSGGSEANSLAILGSAKAHNKPGHVITCATEHPAVLAAVDDLVKQGHRATRLPVDRAGRVSPEAFERAIEEDTFFATVMLANNETGTIQPIAEIARIAHQRGIVVHTDAVQAMGKVPVRVGDLGCDLLSMAGHKFYAPKGVGALFAKRGVPIQRVLAGGHQERDLRPGTENVAGIVGLGLACELAGRLLEGEMARQSALRDELWELLKRGEPALVRNSPAEGCLPNTLHVSFPGVDAEGLTIALDLEGVYVSAGAACASGAREPSHVLAAMGVPRELALSSLRLSLGRASTSAQVKSAARTILECAAHCKKVRDGN